MKRKILSLILAVAMLCAFVPAFAVQVTANINIGDYVQMGTYYGEPILWRCVDIDDNGPLMLSDKILCIKAYDAEGDNTSGSHSRGSERQSYGSNYWADSNMRSWLNSTASANVTWLCGNPPDEDHVWDGYNEYDQEAGFLSSQNFTTSEISAIKEVTQKSIVAYPEYKNGIYTMGSGAHEGYSDISEVVVNYDSAYAENVTDKMFLLDVKQVNAVYNNRAILGDEYYIGQPTAECVANSEYKSSFLAIGKNWYYWLRSPYANNNINVRYVRSDGVVDYGTANSNTAGVRPAFYLNLSSVIFKSGSGTESAPYTVEGTGGGTSANSSSETSEIKVVLNGTELSFDQPPVIIDGRTLVPLRTIFEAMGATVDWDGNTRTVTSIKGSTTVTMTIGSNKMFKNGVEIYLDVPAQLVGDYTMVPVRAVAEAFGAKVSWDNNTRTVLIEYDLSASAYPYSNVRALLIAGYDTENPTAFLNSFRNSVGYMEEALSNLNVDDITVHYMEDDKKHMSSIELERLLSNTFVNISEDDLSIVYYTGHSYYSDVDEDGNLIGHTTTFSGVDFSEFYSIIQENVPGTVLLIYDGCFAGELMNLNNYDDRIKIIASCDADDESIDYYISDYDAEYDGKDKDVCSIFSYAFRDGAVNHLENIDTDSNKMIDFSELSLYLTNKVYNIGDRMTTQQNPFINYLKEHYFDNGVDFAQQVQSHPYEDDTMLFEVVSD